MTIAQLCKGILRLIIAAALLTAVFVKAQDAPIPPIDLRVMNFNIWVGGELVDFSKVIEAIKAANPDVVCLQEAGGNTRQVADALGWHYASERMQIISRFPIIDPPNSDGMYVFIQINPGEVIAVSSVHLPSDPYGPYLVRDGSTLNEVLANEAETRMPFITPFIEKLSPMIEAGIPVLLTGDFNSPSPHDWTEETVAARGDNWYVVDWPVVKAVVEAGFLDTYRTAHPDPVTKPGNTWTYGNPYPRVESNEVVDRIDFVFAGGTVEVIDSEILGEAGGPDVDIGIQPFPSDHRGVVSTVRATPFVPPLFVAAERRVVTVGDPVIIRYHAPEGEDNDRIVIVPLGAAATAALMSLPPYEADFFGSVTFGSAMLTPAQYDVVLVGAEGVELSRNQFWVLERDAVPSVTVEKTIYETGENININWMNAPGNRWDWLGIYAAGDPDLYNYWGFAYTKAAPNGSTIFDATVLGETMLPAGDYEVRLLLDDGYAVLAVGTFTVKD